jgi:SAM-dependent methyltransferase
MRLAGRLCGNCAWFHGAWQVLRRLGLNTTPEHHASFFRRWLAGQTPRRVLVSGAADYGMLARIASPALRITVLDRCPTPLALNRWYARRRGIRIATARADILEYRAPQRFDVICTHSFLGQFTPRRRVRLLEAWHALLRPGGLVLTVNRLRPGAGTRWLGFSPEQSALLQRLARRRAAAVGAPPSRLAELARDYAGRMGAWPIRSEQELTALFERGGFAIGELVARPVVLRAGPKLSGPTTPGGAIYACIAARRL